MSNHELLRWVTIGMTIAICMIAFYKLAALGQWSELVTAVLGAAGFVLTWEITRKNNDV